jgi:predicted dehydrogenase
MISMNRREFLTTSAASLAVPYASGSSANRVAANDKIVVALIGCGGMGGADLGGFIRLPDFEIAALCDIDKNQIATKMKQLEKGQRPTDNVKAYEDYRKMIDERKDLDAVIVATPDHHHAYALVHACHGGKNGQGLDVYCEKPISHNIVEGRAMVTAVRKQKRVCQIGTQQRSGQHFKDAVGYVQSGKLGHVNLCRTWITNNDGTHYGKPEDQNEAPNGVNYDLWLGPAPKHKFNSYRFHHNFRWFFDYGNGLCNDWGVHLNDIILWGMQVHAPVAVSSVGGKFEMKDTSDTPDTLDVIYEYPGFTHIYTIRRGRIHGLMHAGCGGSGHGLEFQGTGGTLTLDRGGWVVTFPDGHQEKHGGSEQHFAHVQNFLHCVRSREKTASDIEDMHRATTTAHLANISYKVKRKVFWDAESERCYRGYESTAKKFVHEDAEANALLLREPRPGWKLTV